MEARSLRALAAAALIAGALAPAAAQEPWVAPKEEAARRNPLPLSDEALQKGRLLYQKNCVACHGAKGKGDGSGIAFLAERTSRRPKDLTDPKLQAAWSDGEIFWKVTNGLKEDDVIVMPAYANEIKKDEDRWALVHFVRTLAARD